MTFSMSDRCGRGNRACLLKNEIEDGSLLLGKIGARRPKRRKGRTRVVEGVTALRLPMWSRCEENYGLNSTFTGLGYLYYFWHPRVPLFPFGILPDLNNDGHAGKLAKRADNWDRCYFPDSPTMILVRENAPRHRILNLYRFYRPFFLLIFPFSEKRCSASTSSTSEIV